MVKKRKIACVFIILSLVSVFAFSNLQVSGDTLPTSSQSSLVGTTDYRDLWESYQQRSFYDEGRFWVFYYNGTNGDHDHEVYTSSTDGLNWNIAEAALTESIDASTSYSIWFDGTYVHNFVSCDWGTELIYERGVPYANGTIIWQMEQTIIGSAYNFTSQLGYVYPQGCIDSNGNPWVAYEMYNSSSQTIFGAYVIKSSTSGGTWNTASNFPYKLSNIHPLAGFGEGVYPLIGGKVLAIYVSSGHAYAQAWTGSSWLPETQTKVQVQGDQYGYFSWSAVSQGDYVNLVYGTADVNYGVGYERYDYATNTFVPETIVQTNPAENWGYTMTPITIDTVTGNIYCFWINPVTGLGDGHYNEIVYKECINGIWDESPTLLCNVSACNIPSPLTISAPYYAYGGYLEVMFNTGLPNTPPYNINFVSFSDGTPSSAAPSPTLSSTSQPTSTAMSPLYIVVGIIFASSLIGFALSIKNKRRKGTS